MFDGGNRYAAPLYVDVKKVERMTDPDGNVEEKLDEYPKVFIGEVPPPPPPHTHTQPRAPAFLPLASRPARCGIA